MRINWKTTLFLLTIALILAAVIPAAPARADTDGNDSFAEAVAVSPGINSTTMEFKSDCDYFTITVDETCSICSTVSTGGCYAYYRIYDQSQAQLQSTLVTPNYSVKPSYKVAPGTYYLRVSDRSYLPGFTPYTVNFNIQIIEEDALENNDSAASAYSAVPGTTYNMVIEANNDYEWFEVDVSEKSSIACTTTNSSGNYKCSIYSSSDLTTPLITSTNPTSAQPTGWKVEPGTYYIKISESGTGSIDYPSSCVSLLVTLIDEDIHENNDTLVRSTPFELGSQVEGISVEARNDYDWFCFTATQGGELKLSISNSAPSINVSLYNSSGVKIDSAINPVTYKHNIDAGQYFLCISPYAGLNYLNSDISFTSSMGLSELEKTQLGKPRNAFFCNDPVNPVIGNFTYEATDISVPARGLPLAFTRFYNSRAETTGPLGQGWQHNWGSKLTVNSDSSVTVLYSDGHEYRFPESGGVYTSPDGCFETLVKNADSSYTLTFKNQSKYDFNSSGQLIRIIDQSGNITSLAYTSGKLTSVTEPGGRPLTFTYTGSKISKVTDPLNHSVQFSYDANGNLATVTDLNGKVTTYGYTNNILSSITDPNGHQVIANSYDAMGRVLTQTDGEGNITEFQYDSANRQTAMIDAKGNEGSFTYNEDCRVTRIDYPGGIYEEYSYDDDGNRLTSKDKNGHVTTCTYDSMGNMLTNTGPAPIGYVTTMTYNAAGNPLTIVDGAGYTTTFTYDSYGRLLTQSRVVNGNTVTTSFSYDSYGQISSITDPNSHATTFTYDQYGNMASKTDPENNTTSFTYDLGGRKLTETDPLSNTWTYTYDNAGHVLTATDPLNNVTTSVYDDEGQLSSVTDANNNTTAFSYDNNGKLETVTDPQSRVTSYAYDANGNLSSISEPGGATTDYSYDALDRLIATDYPDGSSEELTLDGNGNVTARTGRNGSTSTYSYDVLNRMISSTDALNGVIETEYDELGNVVSITDQRDNTSSFVYDSASRLLSSTGPGGHTTSFTYDLAGNKLTVTDPTNAVWSYAYDDNNRLVSTTDPLNGVQSLVYDAAGNVTSSTDANDNTTTYAYDDNNRLVSVTNALNATTSYDYDDCGNLIAVTDGNGNTTDYSYDSLNRISAMTNPLNQTVSNSYDTAGNISELTKADSTSITYDYDSMHKLTGINASGQNQVSFDYNSAGLRSSMTDATGTTTYSYDDLNRLAEVSKSGRSIGYSYDAAGNLTGLDYPGSQDASYSYDDENQLESVTENGNTSTFTYDDNGRRTGEVLANGVEVAYAYDTLGRLTSINHVFGGITIASAAYTYDGTVNPLTMTTLEGQTDYEYDDVYELTEVTYPDNSTESFTYDLAGNRTALNGISYVYDTANRLLQAGSVVYTYDQNGNRITEDAKQYQYDWNNRLTSIINGDETTEFTYDGDGSRTSLQKIVSGATLEASSYIYDPGQGIPRLLEEEIVSGPTLSYVYAGRLLEQTGSTNGTMFYHQDAIGNTLAMTDMTGVAVNTYRYDAFGASELISGTASNNRQFTGHVSDSTGLIYMNARYYDPATGRFLTQDTVPGRPMDPLSYNLYAYCKNNPVAYVDPSGKLRICSMVSNGTAMGGVVIPDFHEIIESQVQNTPYNNYFPAADWIDQPEVQANIAEYNYYHPEYGYTDINLSQPIYGIYGVSTGLQIDENDNVHWYIGPGIMTPGTSLTIQFSEDAPSSSGVYIGAQGTLLLSGQAGIQLDNYLLPEFTEQGFGVIPVSVPAASVTLIYVTDPLFNYHDLEPPY